MFIKGIKASVNVFEGKININWMMNLGIKNIYQILTRIIHKKTECIV